MKTYDELVSRLWVTECERRLDNDEPFLRKKEYLERNKNMLAQVKKYAYPEEEVFGRSEK